ncbi:hypothetical protein OROGR_010705 [Orobanche gracilis]
MWGVQNANLSILWNGSKLPSFRPQRGLRKGDPLSPYLFVLCMERLAIQIQNLVDKGAWQPIRITKDGIGISHLFFADDVLLFCQARKEQIQLVSKTLQDFCEVSGMKVNLAKSRMFCSKNTAESVQQELENITGITRACNLGKYLGIPLLKGRVTKEIFSPIIDKVTSRLASWKHKLLNRAGRVCLAKSVLTALPVYSMQTLWLPQSVCDIIDKRIRACIWAKGGHNRGWNLIPWKDITCPKSVGGLGLRSTRANNIAMLGSLVNSMLHDHDKLWVRMLTEKYCPHNLVLSSQYRYGDSYIWKGIMQAKNSLKESFLPFLGSGYSSLWYDDWLGIGKLCYFVPYVHISDSCLQIKDIWEDGAWNFSILYTMLPDHLLHLISSIPIPEHSRGRDTLRWQATHDGRYTASSAYNLMIGDNTATGPWKRIWRCKVPEKVRFFLWLIAKGALPTNAKIFNNHLSNSAACSRCHAEIEDANHLFRGCPMARDLWARFSSILLPLQNDVPFPIWFASLLANHVHVLAVAVLWWSWRWRNDFILATRSWSLNYVLRQISHDFVSWKRWPSVSPLETMEHMTVTTTNLPSSVDCWHMFVDGSFNPISKRMGCSAVVRDVHGNWISGISNSYGFGNAFLAEVLALELGLKHVWELGHRKVRCFSDCSILVNTLLQDLEASQLWARDAIVRTRIWLAKDWDVHIAYIPRERNNAADALARQACRDLGQLRVWKLPPSVVIPNLCLDILA